MGSVVAGVVLLAVAAAIEEVGPPRVDGTPGPLGRLAGSLRGRVLDVVGPDEVVDRIDVNALLDRIDVDALVARIDVDALVARIDVDALLAKIDVDDLLARIDVDDLVARIDADALLTRIDVDDLVARIDINGLLDRVAVDALLARADVQGLVDRVDLDAVLARVDVEAVVDRVDVEAVVRRAGIPEIVAESTGGLAESLLDLLRRQLLALDVVVTRTVMRLTSRPDLPSSPQTRLGTTRAPDPAASAADVSGHYAGGVTRLVAHLVDTFVATTAFTVSTGALGAVLDRTGLSLQDSQSGTMLLGAALAGWMFTYWWASTAIAGRTPGMALVGLRVVTRDGGSLPGRRAFVRVAVLPLSIALFGLGLVGILVDRERRGLHDVLAESTVVYDWGGREATMPSPLARWLARHGAPVDEVLARRHSPGLHPAGVTPPPDTRETIAPAPHPPA